MNATNQVAEAELQRYLSNAERYLKSAEGLISSADHDNEQIVFHLKLFERYLPKIEQFRPKNKNQKDETTFGENAVPILDDIFNVQLQLEQLYLRPCSKEEIAIAETVPPNTVQSTTVQPYSSLPQLKLQ